MADLAVGPTLTGNRATGRSAVLKQVPIEPL